MAFDQLSEAARLFRDFRFEEAISAATDLVNRGDWRGYSLLALEALSRRSLAETLEVLECALREKPVSVDIQRMYWLASRLTNQTGVMRSASDRLRNLGARSPDKSLLSLVPKGIERILSVSGSTTELHFVPGHSLPVVKAQCDHINLRLLIDNGADEMYLRKEVAAELGLRLIGRGRGIFAGGHRAWVNRSILSRLRLGSVEIAVIPVLIAETIGQIDPHSIDGIIGSQILSQFLSIFDFRKQTLQLQTRQACIDAPISVEDRIFGTHFLVSSGSVDGKAGHYFIDCGGTFGVAPDPRDWRRIRSGRVPIIMEGVTGAGHRINYEVVKDVQLTLKGARAGGVLAVGGIFPNALRRLPIRLDGIISHQALSRFSRLTLSLDPPQVLLTL